METCIADPSNRGIVEGVPSRASCTLAVDERVPTTGCRTVVLGPTAQSAEREVSRLWTARAVVFTSIMMKSSFATTVATDN